MPITNDKPAYICAINQSTDERIIIAEIRKSEKGGVDAWFMYDFAEEHNLPFITYNFITIEEATDWMVKIITPFIPR